MNIPEEGSPPYPCGVVTLFLEEAIMYVFTERNLQSQWTREIIPRDRVKLFLPEIGKEVAICANRLSDVFRTNRLFDWETTRSIEARFRPGYFYEGINNFGHDLLERSNDTVNTTYYLLALTAELCIDLAIDGQQSLIYYVIEGLEHALHHRASLQFRRRYWTIAMYAMITHNLIGLIRNPSIQFG